MLTSTARSVVTKSGRTLQLITMGMRAFSSCEKPASLAYFEKEQSVSFGTVEDLANRIRGKLEAENSAWTPRAKEGKAILAYSQCADEVHKLKPLEELFTNSQVPAPLRTSVFNLGGLGGFPFAGGVGLGAFMAHVPDDGVGVLVYGPHIGAQGDRLAILDRYGQSRGLGFSTCGACIAGVRTVTARKEGAEQDADKEQPPVTQFARVVDVLGGLEGRVLPEEPCAESDTLFLDATKMLYDSIHAEVTEIVNASLGQGVVKERQLFVCGGITINTPLGVPDYFLLKHEELFGAE